MIPRSYLSIVAQCCSSPYRKRIPEKELRDILTGEKKLTIEYEWFFHIALLFNEVPHKFLRGIMKELGITVDELKIIYNSLPEAYQGSYFMEFCDNE